MYECSTQAMTLFSAIQPMLPLTLTYYKYITVMGFAMLKGDTCSK